MADVRGVRLARFGGPPTIPLKITTKKLTVPVIASGGVGSLQDFKDGVIVGGASALLAASVFHYNEYSISDVKEYLKNENIEVRL